MTPRVFVSKRGGLGQKDKETKGPIFGGELSFYEGERVDGESGKREKKNRSVKKKGPKMLPGGDPRVPKREHLRQLKI